MCLEQSEPIRNGFGEIKPDHKQDLIKSVGDESHQGQEMKAF